MEGSGFLRAAWRENITNAVVIRGISDLLVGKEQTDRASWQIIAAKHAAAFAFKLLTHYGKPQAAEVVVKPSDSSRGVRGLPSPDAELLTDTGSAANGTAHEQVKVERTRFDPELFKKLEGFAFASDGMDLPSKEASRKWAMERVRTWQTVDLESFVARFKELRKFAFSTSGLDLPSREAACIWAYKETCAEFGIE